MAKYLIDSTDIEIENVSGTDNLKFNLVNQGLNNLNNYSANETIIGEFNGDTLYRKTIYIDEFPSEAWTADSVAKSYSTGITNLNIPVNMYGMYYNTNNYGSASWPICNNYKFGGTDRLIDTRLSQDGTSLTITCSNDFSSTGTFAYKGYVTIEYTKTS